MCLILLDSFIDLRFRRSFSKACERLHHAFEDLQGMVVKIDVPTMDALVELCFSAIQVVTSVRALELHL